LARSSIPAASGLLLLACLSLAAIGAAADPAASPDHGPLSGARFSVESEVGGAVWSFLEDGSLVVLGPGDLMAEGIWSEAPLEGTFDASLQVTVTDQALRILGALSPDGQRVALYVEATEPGAPDDGAPWPPVSRSTGDRVGLTEEASERPSPLPVDCLRPTWLDDRQVDWDPCGDAPAASPGPWPSAVPAPTRPA
jgi:hypothetical protein